MPFAKGKSGNPRGGPGGALSRSKLFMRELAAAVVTDLAVQNRLVQQWHQPRAAVARLPHPLALDAAVQLAAAPVLPEEGVEVVGERPHGPARVGPAGDGGNVQSRIRVAPACRDVAAVPTAAGRTAEDGACAARAGADNRGTMDDLTLGRLRVSTVVERSGPTRPTWLLPDATAEGRWGSHFGSDLEQARKTRRAFCERYADGPVIVLGTHFHHPTAGRILRHGDAWRFVAPA